MVCFIYIDQYEDFDDDEDQSEISEDTSDSETYGRPRRKRSKKRKNNKGKFSFNSNDNSNILINEFFFKKYLATRTASSDALRYSTRKRAVTNYNEDNAELWGLSEDEDDTFGNNSYTPQPEEEEGDVIESIHDHRRREEYGNEITFIYPYIHIYISSFSHLLKERRNAKKREKREIYICKVTTKKNSFFLILHALLFIFLYIYLYIYIYIIKIINDYSG